MSDEHGLTKAAARKIVDTIFAAIGDAAAKEDDVALNGFGKFRVKATAAHDGRYPMTGGRITIEASRKLTFAPAKAVKNKLNG